MNFQSTPLILTALLLFSLIILIFIIFYSFIFTHPPRYLNLKLHLLFILLNLLFIDSSTLQVLNDLCKDVQWWKTNQLSLSLWVWFTYFNPHKLDPLSRASVDFLV